MPRKTIKTILQTQPACYQDTLRLLFQRGVSYELLKLCYLKYKIIGNGYQNALVGLFLASLDHNKAIKLETYTKRVLIMLAWIHGNEDNYFKLLPKELIIQILGYEYIDQPPYFEFLEFLVETFGVESIEQSMQEWFSHKTFWPLVAMRRFLPFFWQSRDRYFSRSTGAVEYILKMHAGVEPSPEFSNWFKRITSSNKLNLP